MLYRLFMHEVSIAVALVDLLKTEMNNRGLTKLLSVTVTYGALSNIVSDSLFVAYSGIAASDKMLGGARLNLQMVNLVLCCGECKQNFMPENNNPYASCPACGHDIFHSIVEGNEAIVLKNIEAE